MKSDAFFVKGQSHDICQDYAVARSNIIAVSDGCSLINKDGKCYKHPMSDVSSRIACLTTINSPHCEDADYNLLPCREVSNLLQVAMDTTLLKVEKIDHILYTTLIGDGVFHINFSDGRNLIRIISFSPNTPFYLSYGLDFKKGQQFIDSRPTVIDSVYVFDNEWNFINFSEVSLFLLLSIILLKVLIIVSFKQYLFPYFQME
jgi:hypothetical protein